MVVRKKSFIAGLSLLAFAAFAVSANAQVFESKITDPVRPVDLRPLGKEVSTEIIASQSSGVPKSFITYNRVPAGVQGPAMYTSVADEVLYVVSGELNVQLGTDKFVAKPDTLILIPAGTPHHIWNDGSTTEVHVNVIAPVPQGATYASLMKPAQATKVDNAAQYVRPAQLVPDAKLGEGLNAQWLARWDNGSKNIAMHMDKEKPGQGGPQMHFHHFEQVYFVMSGKMQFVYGDGTYTAGPNTFMVIPHGVVHRNWNEGPAIEKNLIMLLNQVPGGYGGDIMVDIKKIQGGGRPAGGVAYPDPNAAK